MDTRYDGDDLGSVCRNGKTSFKIFSPKAESILLRLYKDGKEGEAFCTHKMQQERDGIWEAYVEEDLNGTYYDYGISHGVNYVSCADPYARACGVNGSRSMVIDLSGTDPAGWEADQAPMREAEDIIYELHVKEFSHHPNGGFLEKTRGKYLAFTQEDTTLYQDGIHLTGLSYLKDLGVNYLQLMPVYDYGSVDESGGDNQFNWGYDPVNYNVPEGSYSTDPYHGEVRIRELKEMIQAIHSQGFGVIMDVVYNHTYSHDSWLERSAPGYYYRKELDGTLSNGSGCGNDIASEQPMCSKYILDSVLYWAEEYHMDGFRFDLMGLLDTDLMNTIRQELDQRYGRGVKLIYGEPWAAGVSPMKGQKEPSLRKNIHLLDTEVGMFCDGIRDAVKGHVFEGKAPGFVNGGKGQEENILHSVTAWCGPEVFDRAKAPSQIITYISAHDNRTLWDKLMISMKRNPNYAGPDKAVERANRLAAAIYLTCQGRIFMLSGEEFARTKNGAEDSYREAVELNRIDWERAYQFADLRAYYAGLIRLRKAIPGLCDKTAKAWERIGDQRKGDGYVSFLIHHKKEDNALWEKVFVVYHSGKHKKEILLPEGEWELLADGNASDYWLKEKNCKLVTGSIMAAPVSALILGEKKVSI